MTNTYLTGNPLGSTAPKDLYDNASNFDDALNGPAPAWDDRFLKRRQSFAGMKQAFDVAQQERDTEFQNAIVNIGYFGFDTDYAAGIDITARNQIFRKDGEYYRASAALALPYTTTGDWVTESVNFVSVGDAALRQDLSNSVDPTRGSALVYGVAMFFKSVAELRTVEGRFDGDRAQTQSYYGLAVLPYVAFNQGQAQYIWSASSAAVDNGGSVIKPTATAGSGRWLINQTDALNDKQFGVKADGITDDTVRLQAAFDAMANKELILSEGTRIVTTVFGSDGLILRGMGRDLSLIQRKAAEPTNNGPLVFFGKHSFVLKDFRVDGLRSSQTNGASNVVISGCYDYKIVGISSIRAKAVSGGYGDGILTVNSADQVNSSLSEITACEVRNNDSQGISVNNCWFFKIKENNCTSNGGDGIAVLNLNNPPPTGPTERIYQVTGNFCRFNGGSGIGVSGYIEGYNGSLQINGNSRPTSFGPIIANNHCYQNTQYGLVYQSVSAAISGNHLCLNGNNQSNGGCLLNMRGGSFTDNILDGNFYYGVDAGGATNTLISGNQYRNNGGTSGVGGNALNISAGQGVSVVGDLFETNGDGTGGTNILIRGFDGGTDPVFPTKTNRVSVKNCTIIQLNTVTVGIGTSEGAQGITLSNNDVYGGDVLKAFTVGTTGLSRSNNNVWINDDHEYTVAATGTTVIPDLAEHVTLTGTGTVNNLYTYSRNYFDGRVSSVSVGSPGGGYTPGTTVPLVFSGGGGSGAAGYAIVNNSGGLGAVVMTNLGGGYTSSPTVSPSIAPSSGTVLLSAFVSVNNTEHQTLRVYLPSAATLTSAGNMRLQSNFVGTGFAFLTLVGRNGLWYEVSRS